ncbi:hypothetical protein R1sor_006254 [Riccia sorocarpa]|uniref:DUF952 domain-containing protein n=1 Tax=Riccia sorocarpa TaxID=122646 RepID=A0ABD3HMC8_9MARC
MDESNPTKVQFVYRIAPGEEWEAARAKGAYYGGKLDQQFIHLSSAKQVPGTLERFYRGRNDLSLLQIDVGKLAVEGHLEWEWAEGQQFPHFYGPSHTFAPLPLDAVVESTKLELIGTQHSLPTLPSYCISSGYIQGELRPPLLMTVILNSPIVRAKL